ncbi:MAG TPA: branched-chain amino acid ABC transporter permease [Gaiellaceae bacterium]
MRPITAASFVRGIVVFAALSALPFVFSAHWIVNLLVFTAMYAALASAWNLFSGFSGYVSLGNVAFFGVGAYAAGIVFEHWSVGNGYRVFYVLPLVGLGCALVALPVGWIALRTRAMTFAIVTLTMLFIVQQLAFNLRGLTHGSQGISYPPPPFDVASFERPFYYAMLGVLALSVAATRWLLAARLGLQLFGIRDDEEKARGVGIPVTGVKLAAFAVSIGLTAMVGGIWGYYIGYVYPEYAVDPLVQIGSVLMVFLGGRGTLWGPVLGAFLLVPLQQYMAYRLGASELYLVGYSGVFIVVMLLLPRGILPSLTDLATRLRGREQRRPAAAMEERTT